MKVSKYCLPCLLKQIIRTAEITGTENTDEIFRASFDFLSKADYSKTSPEFGGKIYRIFSEKTGKEDPFREMKDYYNRLFLEKLPLFEEKINSFRDAVKLSVLGNIIDFSAIRVDIDSEIERLFPNASEIDFTVDDCDMLLSDIKNAKTLLYLGDNCGEICLDKLLIKKIREINPDCVVYFSVRGKPAANDNTFDDAVSVGMDEVAEIIDNGDCSMGTVLSRTSESFRKIYEKADVIISKGQGNYESLSDEKENIYFLFMIKCPVVAEYTGVPERSLVCMNSKKRP